MGVMRRAVRLRQPGHLSFVGSAVLLNANVQTPMARYVAELLYHKLTNPQQIGSFYTRKIVYFPHGF